MTDPVSDMENEGAPVYEVWPKLSPRVFTTEAILSRKWYVQTNDNIGGVCIMTADCPPSHMAPGNDIYQVADCFLQEVAHHIVEAHNAWIA